MAVNAVVLLYLNQRDLRTYFGDPDSDEHTPTEPRISSCCSATSRCCGSRTRNCSSRCRPAPMSSTASCSRARRCARPGWRSPTDRWTSTPSPRRATRRPARPSSCGSCRAPSTSIELARWRNRPDRQLFSAPGRLARVGLAARLVDAGLVMSLLPARSRPGRHRGGRVGALRRDPREGPERRLPRPGDPRGPLGRPPLHVPVRHERLALHVRGRQRPRGRLGAMLRRPRAARRRGAAAGLVLRRHPRREGRRPAPPLGRPEVREHRRAIRSSIPGAGSHATTSSPASTSCGCRSRASATSTGRSTSSAGCGATRSTSPIRATSPRWPSARFSVPFVDYARGDGIKIGPGGDIAWTPDLIGDDDRWVDRYHGLWGLDTGDRFAGERAPAGPKYTRTGTVRQSWHDPLGFAGLDKVAPPSQAIPVLEARLVELRTEQPTPIRRRSRRSRPACRCSRRRSPPSGRRLGVEKYRAARVVELHERRGEAGRGPDPGRSSSRRRSTAGDRRLDGAARRPRRRPALAPAPCGRPRAAGRHPATPAGRDLGGPQRRACSSSPSP